MQNKLFDIITALLVLLLAGSAMCATYDSTVNLVEKNSTTWQPVFDGDTATVDFNASGDEFAWHAYGTVPNFAGELAECYALIYYADKDDRFENWDGSNPGICIGMFQVDACSGNFDSGDQTTDLGINLPEYPDFNSNPDPWDEYCNESGDGYDHCCGAKLWVVPCSDYDEPALTTWNPEDYLFETDLIWYDDTDYNVEPSITETTVNVSCVEAGDTVLIGAIVNDGDGEYDLENMIVTTNMSIYGADEEVVLDYIGMIDCISANYSASVTVTVSTIDECPNERERYMGTSFDIYAEDPSGANDTSRAGLDVEPGSCSYMELENYYEDDEDLRTVALSHLWDCNTCPVMWWCDYEMFEIYMLVYSVHVYDEYGNYIGPVGESGCCEDYTATLDAGSSASMKSDWNWWWRDNNKIVIVNELIPGETTLTVHCIGDNMPDLVQVIEFLQPISSLEVTADVDMLYASDECNDVDTFNITAQILDSFGNDIPMPRVPVILYIDREGQGTVSEESYTDSNGTVIFDITLETTEEGTIVSFRAESECREGSLILEIVDPILYCVEMYPETTTMESGYTQEIEYACYTDHDTLMCCPTYPPTEWSATLGEIDENGYFTAGENEGVAEITVNVSGVFGTVDIAINAITNCSEEGEIIANEEFTLTSGTVSITGNYSGDNGYACVQAIGDPIGDWTNDTKGAWVYTNEDVILELNGTGDMYMLNRTSEIWEFYAAGDTAEVEGDEYYALISPIDSCDGITCENGCHGYHLWSYVCDDGECVPYKLIESNCAECGYIKSYSGSGGGSGSGTYPPNWDIPKNVTTGSSNNTTSPDDKVSIPTPIPTMPESPTRPNTSTNNLLNETEDECPESPGFTGIVLMGALLIAIGIIAIMARRKER